MNEMILAEKPKTRRIPAEYLGGYEFILETALYGERKYMVRKDLVHPEWGWNVYKVRWDDEYKWELIIDQMSTKDYALRVAVADASATGIARLATGSDVEWK